MFIRIAGTEKLTESEKPIELGNNKKKLKNERSKAQKLSRKERLVTARIIKCWWTIDAERVYSRCVWCNGFWFFLCQFHRVKISIAGRCFRYIFFLSVPAKRTNRKIYGLKYIFRPIMKFEWFFVVGCVCVRASINFRKNFTFHTLELCISRNQ